MCDPVTAAGLALSAGGTYFQSREQANNERRMQNAREAAFTQNLARNTQYAADAGSIQANNTQKQGRENFDIQRDAEADKVKQAFASIRTQPDYNVGLSEGTPKNVVIARQKASEDAAAKTDRDVANKAALEGYGSALFNTGLDQSQFARLFGGIQDKAGANTRILPIEMNAAANNANKGSSLFPTLLKTAGMATSLYGAAGGSFTNAPLQGPTLSGAPLGGYKQYGLFMNNKPVKLFGYELAGRSPF
jgi:hypothetical protein